MKFLKNIRVVRSIIRNHKIGSFEFRLNMSVLRSCHMHTFVLMQLRLAKKLGYKKISVIEYGVAGGRGL